MNKKSKVTSIVKEPNIYNRTESDVLIIHADTLKLKLKEYEDGVKFKNLSLSVFGVILAILLAFATTDFKNAFGLSSATWQAFFIFILVALGILLIYSIINWIKKRVGIEKIIEDFKKKEEKTSISK